MTRPAGRYRSMAGTRDAIYDALLKAGKPMTAYQLMDAVRPGARLAPPTVYRALGRLIEEGLAHRLESVNAFVACRTPPPHPHPHRLRKLFMLCRNCGTVEEMVDELLSEQVRQCAAEQRFQIDKATLELQGVCAACLSTEEGRA